MSDAQLVETKRRSVPWPSTQYAMLRPSLVFAYRILGSMAPLFYSSGVSWLRIAYEVASALLRARILP